MDEQTTGGDGSRPNVVELRIHGVSGTPPESILAEPFPEQVAGDDVARFFRAAKPVTSGGRSRIVEAFHWGRLTSGSPSRALWLLLVPFAVLNLARYTLLGKGKFADAVLRVLGLVLTSMLVTNIVYVSLEIVVRQCAGNPACLHDNRILWFMEDWPSSVRLLVAGAPVALVISLLWWFGRQTFLYEPSESRPRQWKPAEGSLSDHAFWCTSRKAPVLRAAHVAAACALVGLLYGGILRPDPAAQPVIAVGCALLLVSLLVVALGPNAKLRPDPRFNEPLEVPFGYVALKWFSLAYAIFVLGWVARFFPDGNSAPLSGFEVVTMVETEAAAALLVVLLAVCLWQSGHKRGKSLRKVPRAFRPMWSGCAAVVVAALAVTLATGFSSGLAYRVADFLGRPQGELAPLGQDSSPCCADTGQTIQLSMAYWTGGVLWGVLAVLFLVLLLPLVALLTNQPVAAFFLLLGSAGTAALFIEHPLWLIIAAVGSLGAGMVTWMLGWRADKLDRCVTQDYLDEHDGGMWVTDHKEGKPQPRAIGKIATAWRMALTKYRYHWLLGALALLGGSLVLASGLLAIRHMIAGRTAVPTNLLPALVRLNEIGSWTVSGLIAALLLVGVRSWQGQKMRTAVGVIWDLIAFWPRYSHPICPPPYGGRATLELARWANHQAKTNTVVLSGHSQGSVVSVAAILLLDRESTIDDEPGVTFIPRAEAAHTRSRLCLITYGSQLQWAFARLFPAYLGYAHLKRVHHVLEGRWRNVHRWSDPLGGPVLVWPCDPPASPDIEAAGWHGFGLPGGAEFTRIYAGEELAWGWQLGHDIRLRDPEFIEAKVDRPRSRLRRHSAYYRDPVFDEVVAQLADSIAPAPAIGSTSSPPPGRSVVSPDPGLWQRIWMWVRNLFTS